MAKKRKPAKEKKAVEKEEKPQPKQNTQNDEHTESENPFDFGGLPNRDLKKNLGCG
jgi:hypothetical protein